MKNNEIDVKAKHDLNKDILKEIDIVKKEENQEIFYDAQTKVQDKKIMDDPDEETIEGSLEEEDPPDSKAVYEKKSKRSK